MKYTLREFIECCIIAACFIVPLFFYDFLNK